MYYKGVCVCMHIHYGVCATLCGSDPVEVRVDQRYVVVAGDDVSERRQPLLHPLDADGVRQTVPDVLQLLVRRVAGNQHPVAVT